MGIQACVSMAALDAANIKHEIRQEPQCRMNEDGEYTEVTMDELWVDIPGVGWVYSYCLDSLVYDNKNVNWHITDALTLMGIEVNRN